MDYKELIELSKKAAMEWHGTHEYYQAATLITALCEATETLLAEREAAGWISVEDKLPEAETEVLILVNHGKIKIITTAMYEDGRMPVDDSMFNWYDFEFVYDEENDQYLIPEGWWEYKHYNHDDTYDNEVDGFVTHWMPLPTQPDRQKEDTHSWMGH